MVAMLIGEVVDKQLDLLFIKDESTDEIFECKINDDLLIDCKVGDSGVYSLILLKGVFYVKSFNFAKFLKPLYEEDLISLAGDLNFSIQTIDDPFPEAYIKLSELDRQEELKIDDQFTEGTPSSPQTIIHNSEELSNT